MYVCMVHVAELTIKQTLTLTFDFDIVYILFILCKMHLVKLRCSKVLHCSTTQQKIQCEINFPGLHVRPRSSV